ncbi:MAG TPA: type II toxin-antitoxin system VapB family antitoxin [Caulobacteraceae bacterium]
MATNPQNGPALINAAPEASGERTKKAAVTRALEAFAARRRQKRLLELIDRFDWDESFEYKQARGCD